MAIIIGDNRTEYADIIGEVLKTAWTYYDHNDALIYSWHGEVFLNGHPLYDAEHGGRGNIDCSTLVHLVLQGIPYDKSPYATGDTEDLFRSDCPWADRKIRKKLKEYPPLRKSNELARYYVGKGQSFSGEGLQPGDLVFFQAPEKSRTKYIEKGAFMAISHVGIVAEDPKYMIHCSGTSNKENDLAEGKGAVRYTRIYGRRSPILFVRPCFKIFSDD